MKLRSIAAAIGLSLVLAGCAGGLPEIVDRSQGTFNHFAKLENDYAAQPFCGSAGASTTPGACADPHVVIDMATASQGAQDLLDQGLAATQNPNLTDGDAASIGAAVVGEVGKFAALVAKYTAGLAQ